ncbi:NADH-cytochrome b5 reductase-like, partial [Haplosporangium gracile]
EIAAAKAKKTQAKEQQQHQQQQQQQEQSTTPTKELEQPQQIATAQYGIIPSYSLQTRKKQLRLVLPPEPRKPGPGECCGNDCEPCVNTIYWEDLVAHRERCRKLQMQFEDACRVLEDFEGRGVESGSGVKGGVGKVEEEGEQGRKEGELEDKMELSIRSYRPFKVLQKRYLSKNTLLVVCDLPYYSFSKKKMDPRITMFHLLIRLQQPDGQYLTKAFTPVDMSRLHTATWRSVQGRSSSGDGKNGGQEVVDGQEFEDRMAFLVKLYPSPHATSDMFRALEVYTESGSVGGDDVVNGDNSRNRKEVLFLRGPIQTGRDRQKNQQQQSNSPTAKTSEKKRIVMIAAGSGITPMYQILRALHSQQHHQQQQHSSGVAQEEREREEEGVRFWEADEVDLVYCNRTTDDIWLRQELQSIGVSRTEKGEDMKNQKSEEAISEMAAELSLSLVRRTIVRIQHVLSSASTFSSPSSVNQVPPKQGGRHQFHAGRISLDLLRNTLQQGQDCHDRRRDSKEQLQILVCGPPLFNKDVSAMLTLLNYHDSDACEIHILE